MLGLANGCVFDLLSVDSGEYSSVVPNAVTVQFVGDYKNGSTITQNFTTDGIIDGTGPVVDFQTFHFRGLTGLKHVESPTYRWSLDNVRLAGVSEPASGAALLMGGITLRLLRSRRFA